MSAVGDKGGGCTCDDGEGKHFVMEMNLLKKNYDFGDNENDEKESCCRR